MSRVRRCWYVLIEPVATKSLELAALLAGDGRPLLRVQHRWQALAAHLAAPVVLSAAMLERIGRLDREQWVADDPADDALQALRAAGLVIADGDECATSRNDQRLRQDHWWGLSALAWQHGRWQGQDSAACGRAGGLERMDGLVGQFGLPPVSAAVDARDGASLALPAPGPSALDQLLAHRVTCRNFDPAGHLTLAQLSAVLWRSVAQQTGVLDASGARFAKKAVPSAGGLHPTETYLLVRGVSGLDTGAYHYQPDTHRLQPHGLQRSDCLATLATRWLAGQTWFADAQVLLVLASRHARLQWKYRGHSKAWRAAVLDVGHISQAIYLAGTELGLGTFVTAAINEIDVCQDLGLADFTDAPLAIAGLGVRALQQRTPEFDPAGAIWQPAGE